MLTRSRLKPISILVGVSIFGALFSTAVVAQQQRLGDALNARIGLATQGDMMLALGAPVQSRRLDGDEFWIYLIPQQPNEWQQAGDALTAFGKGMRGQQHIPQPRGLQQLILRFDGHTGKLKAWNFGP
jgi:hypothetical protein